VIRTALALSQKGLAVFPCRQRSKLPATEHGFRDASTDPATIEVWWRTDPNYNVAIATGTISKVFVIDVDGPDAEAELRKLEDQHGVLPSSVEVITARGRHIYFSMPARDLRNSASKVAPGIDVRATGGYVLTPPSIHPTGRRYCWSVDAASVFAPAPSWLLAKIAPPTTNGGDIARPVAWPELIKGVAEGRRDTSATKLAGYLLRRQVDVLVTLELLHMWNETRCTPPLPAADIERVVNSIAGKELKRRGASE
jgi:Bifunctional DNA primase/polymerase, N-terminal/Primase C terminal 1 (PriCT-1)